jgi:hypothetical protein
MLVEAGEDFEQALERAARGSRPKLSLTLRTARE